MKYITKYSVLTNNNQIVNVRWAILEIDMN